VNRQKLPVRTSRIADLMYDRGARALEVEFKNGSVWRYYQVPVRAFRALMEAFTNRTVLDAFTRSGEYPVVLVRGPN
jgi:hypothetical protein